LHKFRHYQLTEAAEKHAERSGWSWLPEKNWSKFNNNLKILYTGITNMKFYKMEAHQLIMTEKNE